MPFPITFPFAWPGSGGSAYSHADATPTGGDGAGSLRHFTSHGDSGLALLIAQYRDSPRVKAWIRSFLDRAQAIDDPIVDVYQWALDVDNALGAQLTLIGKLVGEADGGADTETFRGLIRTRILVNRSQGRISDYIKIARQFAAVASEVGASVRVGAAWPARVEIRVDRTPVVDAHALAARLRAGKAGGVGLATIVHTGARTRAMRLGRPAGYPFHNATTGLGFVADATRGGRLDHVL